MVISTNVSVMSRSINVLMSDGTTERFALVAASDGDVHWRHDVFDLTVALAQEHPNLSIVARRR